MSRQNNSDPLPYVQVDRAVKPKAALLANALGVSTQHALGSLVEWWELCGDPRELETIVSATKEGERPAVVLDGADASLRFKLASGKDVEPVVLVRLGLLEPRGDGFRVRGMSRYFEPIERRLHNRKFAAMGGKASADARRERLGSAQPAGGKGFAARSVAGTDDAQAIAQAEPNPEPKRNGTRNRSATEAEPNSSGQRSAISDQRHEEKPAPASRAPRAEDPLVVLLKEDFMREVGSEYAFQSGKDGVALAWLKSKGTEAEIRARWRRGLQSPPEKWLGVRTLAQLRQKWNDLASLVPKSSTQNPACVGCGGPGVTGWPELGVPTCHPCAGEAVQWSEENSLVPYVDGATRWLESKRRAA